MNAREGTSSSHIISPLRLKERCIGTLHLYKPIRRMQSTHSVEDDLHNTSLHVGNTKSQQFHHVPIATSALILSLLNLLVPLKPVPRIFATASLFVSVLACFLATKGRPSSSALALFSISATFVAYSTHFVRAPLQVTPTRIPSIFEMPGHKDSVFPKNEVFARPVDALNALERSQSAHPHAGDVETERIENALDETRTLPLPPGANGTYIVNSQIAESCSTACARFHYVCAPKHFAAVNLCPVLSVRLGCDSCEALPGSHRISAALPAARGDGGGKHCLSLDSADIEAAHCHVSAPGVQRLCPCVV